MIKLVISFEDGDGCTYSCTKHVPILYESGEAFLVEFEEVCKAKEAEWKEYVERNSKLTREQRLERIRNHVVDIFDEEIKFAGANFGSWHQFFSDKMDGNYRVISREYHAPEVQTLDEWFDSEYNNYHVFP